MFRNNTIRSAYTSVVISISLVLIILGVIGTLLIISKSLSNHVKENLIISIFLEDDMKDIELKKMKRLIINRPYVKQIKYVSKKESAQKLQIELDEDFLNFLGYNPLKNSIDIHLKPNFVSPEYIKKIAKEFRNKEGVNDIIYDKSLIEKITENINKITFWLLAICGVFVFIAIILINNSIRLAMYSKRFLMKTMQLVGASKSFIRKPFLLKSIGLSLLSSINTLLVLGAGLFYLEQHLPNIVSQNIISFCGLSVVIILVGIFISVISVLFSTNRYLKTRIDDLYY